MDEKLFAPCVRFICLFERLRTIWMKQACLFILFYSFCSILQPLGPTFSPLRRCCISVSVFLFLFCISFDSPFEQISMHEGLQLFEEVVQNPIFQHTPIFVFLNKKDLFEQMMEQGIPLSRCFPDYRVSYVV